MDKARIIFFGTPSFVVPVIEKLVENFAVVGVVTAPDTIQGRKKELTSSPVKVFAIGHHIPLFQPEKLKTDAASVFPESDLFVVAAYGKIIPQDILDIPKNGAINIHPSLLPKYRGTSPIQSALLAGETTNGITIMKMDDKMDHGPIITQWTYQVTPMDTFESLHKRMFQEAADRLPEVITQYLNGEITPQEQDHSQATFCHKITRESGYFSLENPPSPIELDRKIRAFYSWPTAWTKLQMANGKWQMAKFLPGKRIQLEGGKPMRIKEFFNGYPELRPILEPLFQE